MAMAATGGTLPKGIGSPIMMDRGKMTIAARRVVRRPASRLNRPRRVQIFNRDQPASRPGGSFHQQVGLDGPTSHSGWQPGPRATDDHLDRQDRDHRAEHHAVRARDGNERGKHEDENQHWKPGRTELVDHVTDGNAIVIGECS